MVCLEVDLLRLQPVFGCGFGSPSAPSCRCACISSAARLPRALSFACIFLISSSWFRCNLFVDLLQSRASSALVCACVMVSSWNFFFRSAVCDSSL